MLHDVQKSALTYQAAAIADRIATEFLVVKIQPEPNLRPAVIDVEGSGFGTSGDDKKHEHGLRELDPFRDSRLLGPTEQLGHCSSDRSSHFPRCMPEIGDWDYLHFLKPLTSFFRL
jgi:hypothetical protein